ncbi:hypothetical protein ACFJIV_08410 [Mucilaginibacter sp. UC70_90]
MIDGYIWSKPDQIAGLRLKAMMNGKEILLAGKDPRLYPPGSAACTYHGR